MSDPAKSDPAKSDSLADASRLIKTTMGREPLIGEANAVAAQADRALRHCVMSDLCAGQDLFHVEPDAYGAAMARIATRTGDA
ncbi:hypothetical protein [Jiella mangrovi]|uniref:Uncharacterized protein n=1 Tax=Jiella mangrovi TaxID=2821407 RepID=A0ABS4BCX1_9HYPH|nr:hypothetical protein [Jiella mangrovi]MBP0614593.1 hypothetical protein [Jiella mangrovi]